MARLAGRFERDINSTAAGSPLLLSVRDLRLELKRKCKDFGIYMKLLYPNHNAASIRYPGEFG
jgi:hypothetical protein